MEKCKITTELAQRAADLRVLDAAGCNSVQALEIEQAPPDNLTEDQKKFFLDKQSQANEAKRALQELATHSITKRRCTSKTQQPGHIDVEPQTLSNAHLRSHRWVRWNRLTSIILLHM